MSDWLEIHALADGELSGDEKRRAEERLKECAKSRAEFQAVQDLRSTLRSKCPPGDCAQLWSACCDRLDEIDKTRRVERFVGRYAWGLCAVFFVVILSAAVMNRTLGPNAMGTGDVAKVVAGLGLRGSRSEATGEDMRNWIRNSSAQLDLGSLRVLGFQEGIREGREVAVFYLLAGDERLSLVAVRGLEEFEGTERVAGTRYRAGQIENLNCVSWTDRGFGLMLVGEGECASLCAAADQIRLR